MVEIDSRYRKKNLSVLFLVLQIGIELLSIIGIVLKVRLIDFFLTPLPTATLILPLTAIAIYFAVRSKKISENSLPYMKIFSGIFILAWTFVLIRLMTASYRGTYRTAQVKILVSVIAIISFIPFLVEKTNPAEKQSKSQEKKIMKDNNFTEISKEPTTGGVFYKALFTIFAVTLFCISYFICEKIKRYGLEISYIQSVGGKTLEEAYYAEVGKMYVQFAEFLKVFAASVSVMILCIAYRPHGKVVMTRYEKITEDKSEENIAENNSSVTETDYIETKDNGEEK